MNDMQSKNGRRAVTRTLIAVAALLMAASQADARHFGDGHVVHRLGHGLHKLGHGLGHGLHRLGHRMHNHHHRRRG
jgi:hypothetical protein